MKPTKQVAVFIETSRAYGRGLLRGVSRFHQESGQWQIFFRPQDLDSALPKWLKSWRGDGILARIANEQMARALLATRLPLIDLRGGGRKFGLSTCGCDNDQICRAALEHLLERGLRQFAFVGEPIGYHVYDDQRRKSFVQQVEQRGLVCYDYRYAGRRATHDLATEQRRFLSWMTSLPKPIGIMAVHDDRGMQVLDACRKLEIAVPDQVAVIGVDNDEFLCALSIPSLTSVDPNSERIGYEAALELNRMMNRHRPRNMLFPPLGIVARQSTDVLNATDTDIAAAVRFIRQNACQGIRVSDVEQQIALSRTLLNRRFKAVVGRTPKEEILRVQLEHACKLLVDTDLPIAKVAISAGFASAKYFISAFNGRMAMTPRGYRLKQGRHDKLSSYVEGGTS